MSKEKGTSNGIKRGEKHGGKNIKTKEETRGASLPFTSSW